MNKHIPVFLNEAIEYLNIKPSGTYVDMTLGRGGHSEAILKKLDCTGRLISLDQDQEALNACLPLNEKYPQLTLKKTNFIHLKDVLTELNIEKVDGILFDLGVSSPQFDQEERGFSFRYEAKLDMRMDQEQKLTAFEVVNYYPEDRLKQILYEYGDERYAPLIAKTIVTQRKVALIQTTKELVELVKSVKPIRQLRKAPHPAKKTFQALRIEVNDELNNLIKGLKESTEVLNPEGRLVVISFHLGEDRLIKQYFQSLTKTEGTRHGMEAFKISEETEFNLITKKPLSPSQKEINQNYRSESAKLRVIERKGA